MPRIKKEEKMKSLRIAIAGSHSTGKSTLARRLARRLGIKYLPDIVRQEAVKKGFTINENTPPQVQMWLVMRQWELENTSNRWVADKCLFDYQVYGEVVLKDRDFLNVIKKIVAKAKYDHVFWVPIEIPLEDDGVRSANEKFREIIQKRYAAFLKKRGVKAITVRGSKEERVRQALAHIAAD
jgi:nicotinamide riboside kinase